VFSKFAPGGEVRLGDAGLHQRAQMHQMAEADLQAGKWGIYTNNEIFVASCCATMMGFFLILSRDKK
jgi:hypothetical protein